MMEPQRETPQPERLSWAEICARYPREWVVLVDLDMIDEDCDYEIRSAVVLDHSPQRDVGLRRTRHLRNPADLCAHLFTGPFDEFQVEDAQPLEL